MNIIADELYTEHTIIINTTTVPTTNTTNTFIQPKDQPKNKKLTKNKDTHTQPKYQQYPVISNSNMTKKQQKQAIPPNNPKTNHKINRPNIKEEEVQRYMLYLHNNPNKYKCPMNNPTICL